MRPTRPHHLSRRQLLAAIAAAPPLLVLAACGGAQTVTSGAAPASVPATATAAASPAAAGSAAASPASQPVALKWDSYNFAAPGIGGQAIQMIIDEFQAKYPTHQDRRP